MSNHSSCAQKAAAVVASVLLAAPLAGRLSAAVLPGDLIVANTDYYSNSGSILKIDPVTGAQAVLSSGGNLIQPSGLALDADGSILVTDYTVTSGNGRLIRINPNTGAQTVITSSLINPVGIVVDPVTGNAYVTEDSAAYPVPFDVVRVDLHTGARTVIANSAPLHTPGGIAIDPATGSLLVADFQAQSVIRVNPVTGAEQVLNGSLPGPMSVHLDSPTTALVASVPFLSGHPEVDRIDLATGQATTVSADGLLVGPVDAVLSPTGRIIVADAGPGGTYGGVLVSIDPVTGQQSVLSYVSHPGAILSYVPEPASAAVATLGTLGLILPRRRTRRAS